MSITQKLLWINTLICVAFIGITLVVFFSFRHVEKTLTTIFATETRRIIENSNMTRELTRVLSDLNLVASTFYGKNDVLSIDGQRLIARTETLMTHSGDEDLKRALNGLSEKIKDMMRLCEKINAIHAGIMDIRGNFDETLTLLDTVVAQKLVDLMVTGEDVSSLIQVSSLIGGYREAFMRINLEFMELGIDHFKHPVEKQEDSLGSMLDDIHMRLRTLSASDPVISGYGTQLVSLIQGFKQTVIEFHHVGKELDSLLEGIHDEKEILLSTMERTDRQVAKKTGEATQALTAQINRSRMMNLIILIGILPIVFLGGLTAYSIKRPVQKVIEYIERIAKGDTLDAIEDEYKGEFAQVRDNLNRLIHATNSVTGIAEKIASGDVDVVVRERSNQDRLMRALNEMILRIKQLLHETDHLIHAVGQGRLDIRGNPDAFSGGWRDLVVGINELIEGFSNAVSSSAILSHEMKLAKKIQISLLPGRVEHIHPDLEIAAEMIPADQVGGDFYDITFDRSGALWLAIGDVSGHGVTPGLIMMMAQTIHASITTGLDCSPCGAVVLINQILYKNVRERLNECHFMTFTALKYLGGGRFQYAGAHLSMVVFRQKTRTCELIRTRGIYLNFKKDISRKTQNAEFHLDPGDILVLYTDGLTEVMNQDGEMLDLDGFVKMVEQYAHQEPEAMKTMIMTDVIRWCGNRRADDMSIVIVKQKGSRPY
jgi:serine phosphatase RsbU (regulator of sigma subunit)